MPETMACSTLNISSCGVIFGAGAAPPPPIENAAAPMPTTTSETALHTT